MHVAVSEYARHVVGLEGANSTEMDPETPFPVIDLLPEQKEIEDLGGTMRLGAQAVELADGTRAHEAYDEWVVHERHRHRYEVNNHYRPVLVEGGLVVSARREEGRQPLEPRRPLCGLILPRRGDGPVQMADRDGQVAREPCVLGREREDSGAIDTDQLAGPRNVGPEADRPLGVAERFSERKCLTRGACRVHPGDERSSCVSRCVPVIRDLSQPHGIGSPGGGLDEGVRHSRMEPAALTRQEVLVDGLREQ
jgi:hypothetical protein